jgi:hypothetical protein
MSMKINFGEPSPFEPRSFSPHSSACGLYFIFLPSRKISYPLRESRLIYIGMSEKVTNSISSRLNDHFDGRSGNLGLANYRKTDGLKFVCINFETLKPFWAEKIEKLESYFILDFVKNFGVYPICNNKSGFPDFDSLKTRDFSINWTYFD